MNLKTMDLKLLTFEKFKARKNSYTSKDLIEKIKKDALKGSEIEIIELIKKELLDRYPEGEFETYVSDSNKPRSIIHGFIRPTHYPDLIMFKYDDYLFYFGLNSTRNKITIDVEDSLTDEQIYGDKVNRRVPASTNVINAVKKVVKILKELDTEENNRRRESARGIKKFDL